MADLYKLGQGQNKPLHSSAECESGLYAPFQRNESPSRKRRAGFAVAPILYLLTLAGVAGGVLFSGYSQILRANVNATNANIVKNDLSGALTTLAATAELSADQSLFCPPGSSTLSADCSAPVKLVAFGDLGAEASKLPNSYASAGTTGAPYEVGVFAAGAGVKQLDPWGHFYIYCRWENARANSADPAMALISAGANAVLETKCGDATPKGDDQIQLVSVGAAIQRAAVWQDTGTSVEYGQTGTKVTVSDEGVITATGLIVGTATFTSLDLTAPLPITSGGTGAANIATARSNLGSGVTGDALFLAATTTAARNVLGATSYGHYLLSSAGLVADTASAVRLDLLGAGVIGNEVFVAPTAQDARTTLGATNMGHYLFSSSTLDATLAGNVRVNLLGAGAVGESVFVAGTTDAAQTALGATAVGKAVFMATDAAAGRTALGGGAVGSPLFTAGDQATAWSILGLTGSGGTLNVDITGEAGSVDGANITGTVPIAHGGTGGTSASAALDNLFGGDSTATATLNVDRLAGNSIDSSKLTNVVTAGTYNQVEVDSAGRVISGASVPIYQDRITDGVGDSVLVTSDDGGKILFSTASAVRMVIDAIGNVGIGIDEPLEKLHIFGGNARISGPSDGYRELQFATSTAQKRWVVAADDSTETGFGNTGSDFVIRRYTDAGAAADTMTIDRATGDVLFSGGVASSTGFLGYFTGTFDGTFIGTVGSNISLGPDASDTNPRRSGDATTGFFSPAAGTVSIATGGTERVRVGSDGAVTFGAGAATPGTILDMSSATNSMLLPQGTEAQRPAGVEGMVRYNTTSHAFEIYQGSAPAWFSMSAVSTAGSTSYLGGAPTTASPSRSDDLTTGLFSDTASTVGVTISGTQRLLVTSTGVRTEGLLSSANLALGSTSLTAGSTLDMSAVTNSLIVPKGTAAQRPAGVTGMMRYNTDTAAFEVYQGSTPSWFSLGAVSTSGSTQYLGADATHTSPSRSDDITTGLFSDTASTVKVATSGVERLAVTETGINVNGNLSLLTATGRINIGGSTVLRQPQGDITSIGIGLASLDNQTTGSGSNIAIGFRSLRLMSTGTYNVALGGYAMVNAFDAKMNVAVGYAAGGGLSSGTNNSIFGFNVGRTTLSTGSHNILIGTSSAVDTPLSSTSNWLNIGNTIYGDLSLGAVAIGAPAVTTGAALDMSGKTNSMIVPKGTAAQRPAGVTGMLRYNTDTAAFEVYQGSTPSWFSLGAVSTSGSTQYLGADATHTSPSRSDDITTGLFSDTASTVKVATSGVERLAVTATGLNIASATGGYAINGVNMLHHVGADTTSVGIGYQSLQTMTGTGSNNYAFGYQALKDNIANGPSSGRTNVALGYWALMSNTVSGSGAGGSNNAIGSLALYSNTVSGTSAGSSNNVLGVTALNNNNAYGSVAGSNNNVIGVSAMYRNTVSGGNSGSNNNAIGTEALGWNTASGANAGSYNNAFGYRALYYNTGMGDYAGSYNNAIGRQALYKNSGSGNTVIGSYALGKTTSTYTGSYNVALGYGVGSTTLVSGSSNILIGTSSAVDTPLADTSNWLNIGNTIYGDLSTGSVAIGAAAVTTGAALDMSGKTNSMIVPKGTEAQRPAGVVGMVRYNNDSNSLEVYQGSTPAWVTLGAGATAGSSMYLGADATHTSPSRSDDVTTGLFSDTASSVAIATSGTERLRVTGSGYVGIGTSSPVAPLEVRGSANIIVFKDNGGGNRGAITTSGGHGALELRSGAQVLTARIASIGTSYLTGGSLAIGTATPSQLLDVNGNINVSTATGAYYIGNVKFMHQPAGDTTSVGVGPSTLAAQTETGLMNVALGGGALRSTTTGNYNVAVGNQSLMSNETGAGNVAIGIASASNATSGDMNTVIGGYAGNMLSTGSYNLFAGLAAGAWITSGIRNVVLGLEVASTTLSTGSNNILIGTSSAVDTPAADTSNWLNIGNTIYGDLSTGSVAIGAAAVTTGAALDMSGKTNAMIVPKGTEAQRPAGVVGMVRYNNDSNSLEVYQGSTPAWVTLGAGATAGSSMYLGADATHTSPSRSDDITTGLFSDTASTVKIATSGTERLSVTTTGVDVNGNLNLASLTNYLAIAGTKVLHQPGNDTTSMGLGIGALANQTATGVYNFAFGYNALGNISADGTSQNVAHKNVAIGFAAMGALTASGANTGGSNVAIGSGSQGFATTIGDGAGSGNVSLGYRSLYTNTAIGDNSGRDAVAIGTAAMTTNIASGNYAGGANIAIGVGAMYENIASGANAGSYNTAVGRSALRYNGGAGDFAGSYNNAYGYQALYKNTGSGNTVIGSYALGRATSTYTGSYNVALGYGVGSTSLVSGSSNILIGTSSAVDTPAANTSNWLNIGNTIYGDLSTGSVAIGAAAVTTGAALDMSGKTNSMIVPKGTAAQRPTAVLGMVRYNTTSNSLEVYQGSSPAWVTLGSSGSGSGTTYLGADATHTSPSRGDDVTTGLFSDAAGTVKVSAAGQERLAVTATGLNIASATGGYAINGVNLLHHAGTDTTSVGIGRESLQTMTGTGAYNHVFGAGAMQTNASSGSSAGAYNSIFGYYAFNSNTASGIEAGSHNVGVGRGSLNTNTGVGDYAASHNVVVGRGGLYANTATGANSGSWNNVVGRGSLAFNTASGANAGSYNNVIGYFALRLNTGLSDGAASYNNVMGYQALYSNTGVGNTVIGSYALGRITSTYTGSYNVALGYGVGSTTLVSGSNNILIGTSSAVDTPAADTSNWLNIGNTIYGDLSTGSVAIGAAAVTTGAALDMSGKTNSMIVPKGSEAQRPAGVVGMVRYNNDSNSLEVYQGSTPAWVTLGAGATAGSSVYLGADATHTSPSRSDDVTTGLFSDTASTVSIATAGTERLRVTATGSVGIGTNAPTGLLQVAGSASQVPLIVSGGAYAGSKMRLSVDSCYYTDFGDEYINSYSCANNPTRSLKLKVNGTSIVNLTSSGSVGIATTTPAQVLDVNGNINVSTATGAYYIGNVKFIHQPVGDTTSVGVGPSTLAAQTATERHNIALGYKALQANTTGRTNIAIGTEDTWSYAALGTNKTGGYNIAIGEASLARADGLDSNIALGYQSLWTLSGGYGGNVMIGTQAAYAAGSLTSSVGIGSGVMAAGGGTANVALGASAMYHQRGDGNVAIGANAMRGGDDYYYVYPVGGSNTVIGRNAYYNVADPGMNNTILGAYVASTTLTTGSSNILIGTSSLVDTPAADTSNWLNIGNTIYGDLSTGSVAIGAAAVTTGAALDMSGKTNAMIVPKGTEAQRPTGVVGMVRYNNDSNSLEVYQGSTPAWVSLGASASASACTGPDAFSFTNQTDVAVNTQITSNTVTLTGASWSCTASAICTNCVIIKNGTEQGTTANFVAGDTIAIRQTSSSSYGTTTTASVAVGSSLSGNWDVTTTGDVCSGTPTVGAVCSDGTVYAGLSPDGNVKMYTTRCDVGQAWDGSTCTGTRTTKKWSYAATINTGVTNAVSGRTNTNNLYALNGTNADSPYEAATFCQDLVQNGQSDWYLPSSGEINVLYTSKAAIGNFDTSGTYYWSSAENNSGYAWTQRFSDGNQNADGKYYGYLVRCVRNDGTALPEDPATTMYLGKTATATSPSRDGDITTGLFSDTASTVKTAISGTERLSVTTTGADLNGNLNLVGITNYIAITGTKVLHQPAGDVTSVGVGPRALASQTATNLYNTAQGYRALTALATGTYNTAFGADVMRFSQNGIYNTGFGGNALANVRSGSQNTAMGVGALAALSTGMNNTAVGMYAMAQTITGSYNVGLGHTALYANLSGWSNVAVGYSTLRNVSSGNYNVAVGYQAGGTTGSGLTTGNSNIILGYKVASTTLTTGSNNILIGTSNAVDTPAADTSNWLNIGNTIYGDLSTGSVSIGAPAVTTGVSLDMSARTNSMIVPKGTSAQRPAGVEGMIRYNTNNQSVEVYQGASWLSLGMTSTAGSNQYLGADATHTSPSRSDDVTTGLFSDVAATVKTAIAGVERLAVTATGLNLSNATSGYAINNVNILHHVGTDTTSVGIGPQSLQTMTGTGLYNYAFGYQALQTNAAARGEAGRYNSAIGYQALQTNTATGNRAGASNTALGRQALQINTASGDYAGSYNNVLGPFSLWTNITSGYYAGSYNNALGSGSLYTNTASGGYAASYNNAMGASALYTNTTNGNYAGSYNNAVGIGSLYSNTASGTWAGSGNNAIGRYSFYINTASGIGAGSYNNVIGNYALQRNTGIGDYAGSYNNVMGHYALYKNSGAGNTVIGSYALGSTTATYTGSYNVALGYGVGSTTLVSGSNNILIGTSSLVDTPAADTSNWLNIGNTIYGDLSTGSIALGAPAVTTGVSLDMSARTNSMIVPKGTDAQRPVGVTGMIRYNTTTNAVEVYQGASPAWLSLGAVTTAGSTNFLGANATNTSPSRSDDATTGFFSDAAATVKTAIAGVERLSVTATGLHVNGNINVNAISNYYAIAGKKILHQPNEQVTSIAIGSDILALQTGTNVGNSAVGFEALYSLTVSDWGGEAAGSYNSVLGYQALRTATFVGNGAGSNNVAIGKESLSINVTQGSYTGSKNVAVGLQAMNQLTAYGGGTQNNAIGFRALYSTTVSGVDAGSENNAMGRGTLYSNTATGSSAGSSNNAIGYQALSSNTASGNVAGSHNSAIGRRALYRNTGVGDYAGSYNNVMGYYALYNNTGAGNTVIGSYALGRTTGTYSGSYNVALGYGVGSTTLVSGSSNILIGTSSAVDTPAADTSNWLNIGNTIYGDLSTGSVAIGAAAVTTGAALDMSGKTNAMIVPKGTEAQRPAGVVGMVRYNNDSNALEVYQGSSPAWVSLGSSASAGATTFLGADATHTSPSRSDDVTTGLFSDLAATVKTAIAGVERLAVTATGINLPNATEGYAIGGVNMLHHVGTDTTSVGIGPESLQTMTGTGSYNYAFGAGALQTNSASGIGAGTNNNAMGWWALHENVTTGSWAGAHNNAIGDSSLSYNTGSGTLASSYNNAIGMHSLQYNTVSGDSSGSYNNAIGFTTLSSNTASGEHSGSHNNAIGQSALNSNWAMGDLAGSMNNAIGMFAFYENNVEGEGAGSHNNVIGSGALYNNTASGEAAGCDNNVMGSSALENNTASGFWAGSGNNVIGMWALAHNGVSGDNAGSYNNAIGNVTLANNTASGAMAGSHNNAIGSGALSSNTGNGDGEGSYNNVIGHGALSYNEGKGNTVLGSYAMTRLDGSGAPDGTPYTGSYNVALGYGVGSTTLTTGSSNILIGTSSAVDTPAADTSNWLNIGNTIYGDLSTGSVAIGAAAVTTGAALDMSGKTNSMIVPKGTDAQRPTGVEGMVRYNTTSKALEIYQGTTPAWFSLSSASTAGSDTYLGTSASLTSPRRSDDATTGLFSPAADTVAISTGATERLRVTSLGRVGIGTTSPAYQLDNVATDETTSGTYALGRNNLTVTPTAASSGVDYAQYNVITSASPYNITGSLRSGANMLTYSGTGTLTAGYGSFNQSGNAGTGTITSLYGSYNYGYNNTTGTVGTIYGMYGYGHNVSTGPVTSIYGSYSYARNASTGTVTNLYGANIATANSTAGGTVTNARGLNISGFTNAGTITTGYGIYIGTILGTTNYGIYQSSTTNQNYFAGDVGIKNASPAYPLQVGTDATNGNGAYVSIAGVWTSISDARVKENVRPIKYGLNDLMKLKPVNYEMKDSHEKQIGLIAQDVMKVVPEVVSGSEKTRYGLSYDNLVALTVKSIQELKVANDNQSEKVAALVEENKKLRAELLKLKKTKPVSAVESEEVADIQVNAAYADLPEKTEGETAEDETRGLLLLVIKIGAGLGGLLVIGLAGCGYALYRMRRQEKQKPSRKAPTRSKKAS